MITNNYTALITDLGKALNLQLSLDSQNACCIRLKDNLTIVLEPDLANENLLIVMEIGSPQPGAYRTNIFREALKANGLPPPRNGIFSYSSKKDTLLLSEQLPLDEINAPQLLSTLKTLMQKARVWKNALTQLEVPSYLSTEETFGSIGTSKTPLKGIFGL